jgi:hypothetical protein
MHKRSDLIAVLFVVGCQGSEPPSVVTPIPRYAGAQDTLEARFIGGLSYDPVDEPIAWNDADTLVIAHREQYSGGDVYGFTCAGSGFYAVARSGRGPARPLGVGEPACRAVTWHGGVAFDRSKSAVLTGNRAPGNRTQLVRVALPNGPVDTIHTKCQVYMEDPDVSRDGHAIAFRGLCSDRKQKHWELYVVRDDGSGLRQLPGDSQYSAGTPRWSADGRRLAYVRTSPPGSARVQEVGVVDSSGSNRRILASGTEPAWSPDDHWIAYIPAERGPGRGGSIHVVRPDGTGDREIFRNQERSTYFRGWGDIVEGLPSSRLTWSPDGRWLAFSRRYDQGTSVWRVNARSGDLRQVTRRTH